MQVRSVLQLLFASSCFVSDTKNICKHTLQSRRGVSLFLEQFASSLIESFANMERRGTRKLKQLHWSKWTFTYLWPESWPSACCAPVWRPCSSAAAWSGSRAPNGSSAPQPGTYPLNFYPGRRPACARQSPGPAGAPWREPCARMTGRGKCQRGQSCCGRPWQPGPWGCRGIWPGGSASSPPATARTPPGFRDSHRADWNSGSGPEVV